MNRMVYYHPAPILEKSASASGIRPRKMLEAFRSMGYAVDLVSGYSHERRQCIEMVKNNVKNGIKYDFAYGENTTMPIAMNDISHIPFSPFMDYAFWVWMKKNNIPFGFFYRDIHWQFPEIGRSITFYKRNVQIPFHYLDIFMLKKLCTYIFFPDMRFVNCVPIKLNMSQVLPLPPGCDLIDNTTLTRSNCNSFLQLFYVGGITPPLYEILPVVNFVANTNLPLKLTICCRETEYKNIQKDVRYINLQSPKIQVIHKSGIELEYYWKNADIFIFLWKNSRYLNITVPFKIIESIGYGLPIITTINSPSSEIVLKNNFGWAIPSDTHSLYELLSYINKNRSDLNMIRKNIREKRKYFTWEARAKYVISSLMTQ